MARRMLLALGLGLALAAAAVADRFEATRERIRHAVAAGEVPSLAVGVAYRGEVVWEEAFGWADRERRIPADIHTPYSLASVSKPFTATALMLLVERGLVDLDRSVNEYLETVRIEVGAGDPSAATVRRVANHTAGLPLHHRFYPGTAGLSRTDETIRIHGILETPPGEHFRYSNLGYGILERVIEEVSSRDFGIFLDEELFGPLGLQHAAVITEPGIPAERARRHGSDGRALPFYDSDHRGGSALWACVPDLLRFGLFHLGEGEGLLSRRSLLAMRRAGPDPVRDRSYGLGWSLGERRGRPVMYHTGGMPGAAAVLTLAPAHGVVIAVLANGESDLPSAISDEILEVVVPPLPRSARGGTSGRAGHEPRMRARPSRLFRGGWHGRVRVDHETYHPVVLEIRRPGITGNVAGEEMRVYEARFRHREARILGSVPMGPGADPGLFVLSLYRRGDSLSGSLTTVLVGGPGRLPSALSHWVELEGASSSE